MCRNRGFTLVELLVALAIFAIMSGFAFRALNSMLEGTRLPRLNEREIESLIARDSLKLLGLE